MPNLDDVIQGHIYSPKDPYAPSMGAEPDAFSLADVEATTIVSPNCAILTTAHFCFAHIAQF